MKLDVSTALKSQSEKNAFSGAFCCCQLVWATCCNAGNGATLLLSSSVFVRACVCGCQSKREARPYMGKRYNRRKYSQMMAGMKETSSQSTVEGCVPARAASSNICRLHLPSALPILREESLQNWSIFSGRMLLNVLYANTASYSEQSDSKCPTLSYSNGSFPLFVYSTKSCMLHNKIIAHYRASAQRVHILPAQTYFMSCQEKK